MSADVLVNWIEDIVDKLYQKSKDPFAKSYVSESPTEIFSSYQNEIKNMKK